MTGAAGSFRPGSREFVTRARSTIPRGTPHAFANASGAPTRLLGLATPGGVEEFFAAQEAYFAQLEGTPDLAILGSIGARYGSRLLGPRIEVAAPGAPQS